MLLPLKPGLAVGTATSTAAADASPRYSVVELWQEDHVKVSFLRIQGSTEEWHIIVQLTSTCWWKRGEQVISLKAFAHWYL